MPVSVIRQETWLGFAFFTVTRKILEKLGITEPDNSGGERQHARRLWEVRPDHKGRYVLAAKIFRSDVSHPLPRILDIACGTGYGAYLVASKLNGARITAVDLSTQAIDFAKTHWSHPSIEYVVRDAMEVKQLNQFFDYVTCFETIEHLPNDIEFLQALSSVLSINGLLLLSCPNQKYRPFDQKAFPFHRRHYTPEEFRQLLSDSGFDILEEFCQPSLFSQKILAGVEGMNLVFIARRRVTD